MRLPQERQRYRGQTFETCHPSLRRSFLRWNSTLHHSKWRQRKYCQRRHFPSKYHPPCPYRQYFGRRSARRSSSSRPPMRERPRASRRTNSWRSFALLEKSCRSMPHRRQTGYRSFHRYWEWRNSSDSWRYCRSEHCCRLAGSNGHHWPPVHRRSGPGPSHPCPDRSRQRTWTVQLRTNPENGTSS